MIDTAAAVREWLTPRVVWLTVGCYILVFVVYGAVWWNWFGSSHAGLFGDMFGALNALFSGLAMLGVVAAILLQRDQLRYQGKELKLQLDELEATTAVLREQADLMRNQNTFQVLTQVLLEYRRPEMMDAIAALWSLYRTTGPERLLSEYERQHAETDALHGQRRVVTQFYNWLGGIRALKLVPDDAIYSFWTKSELRIIDEVLLPLERHLSGAAGKKSWDWMKRLYDDAP